MRKQQSGSKRPDGWQGGKAMFAERAWVLLDTAVSRASVHYSCVGHADTRWEQIKLLAQAKKSLREAFAIGGGMWPDRFTADHLDVLSTVALRGIKVLGIGLGPLAPDPKLALSLAEEGLQRCGGSTEPHTPVLLHLDRAESLWLFRNWKEARDEAFCARVIARVIYGSGIPDKPQRVRVMKRLGALNILDGRTDEGWQLIEEAYELALDVAPGQAKKIEGLMKHLRRPWWHPLKWAVRMYQ